MVSYPILKKNIQRTFSFILVTKMIHDLEDRENKFLMKTRSPNIVSNNFQTLADYLCHKLQLNYINLCPQNLLALQHILLSLSHSFHFPSLFTGNYFSTVTITKPLDFSFIFHLPELKHPFFFFFFPYRRPISKTCSYTELKL